MGTTNLPLEPETSGRASRTAEGLSVHEVPLPARRALRTWAASRPAALPGSCRCLKGTGGDAACPSSSLPDENAGGAADPQGFAERGCQEGGACPRAGAGGRRRQRERWRRARLPGLSPPRPKEGGERRPREEGRQPTARKRQRLQARPAWTEVRACSIGCPVGRFHRRCGNRPGFAMDCALTPVHTGVSLWHPRTTLRLQHRPSQHLAEPCQESACMMLLDPIYPLPNSSR
ncbi:uncharacterized protein LOC123028112 isoform X3 [Varanus komodoensis]|uniref:uncharacterized protein LOC123028112 isoform X3 n=1 Tax=Varanus komodoensis TaxID=61221 RepID=UPI001CF7EC4A|nr:uncharacterized protein LOC123028112 isoform X3 [Varanus komodoensis]